MRRESPSLNDPCGSQQWPMTAYMQLYLARSLVTALPKPWEKYQAYYKNDRCPNAIHSPTQTQRGFGPVLNHIGTPARPPKQRGNPTGRKQGETQEKRQKKKIIFKSDKPCKKSLDFNIPEFGKNIEMREPQKNSPTTDLAKKMAAQIMGRTHHGIQVE